MGEHSSANSLPSNNSGERRAEGTELNGTKELKGENTSTQSTVRQFRLSERYRYKMQLYFFYGFLFTLCIDFAILQTNSKRYKCFPRSVYIRNCKLYNYEAPSCFKWNVTLCPDPVVRHQETHCTVYTCQEFKYRSGNSSKKVELIYLKE